MPQFDPSTYVSQLFWLAVCFASVTMAFVKFLLPRLQQALIYRHTRLEVLRQKADALMHEAAKLNAKLDARLKETHEDAFILLQRHRQKLLNEQHVALEKHDQDLTRKMTRLHAKLDKEYQEGLQTLKDEARTYVNLLNAQFLQAETYAEAEKETKPVRARAVKPRRAKS